MKTFICKLIDERFFVSVLYEKNLFFGNLNLIND